MVPCIVLRSDHDQIWQCDRGKSALSSTIWAVSVEPFWAGLYLLLSVIFTFVLRISRCVLASLYSCLSIGLSVGPSVGDNKNRCFATNENQGRPKKGQRIS